jgi:GNAT superfamily N-acetyltransferase
MQAFGGRPGRLYGAAWWRAVHMLYEEAFPGLPAGIARAAAVGVGWADVTTPFALFDGDRCVAHVGVLSHRMRLGGRSVSIAGVHAVCTTADRRRRGLCRRLLTDALAWADRHHELAKLATDDPEVYAGHGFRQEPQWRFEASARPSPVRARPLRPSSVPGDAALLADSLARRAPVSAVCATDEPGWLFTIDAALGARLDRVLWHLPDHDAVIAAEVRAGVLWVLDVVASRLPPAGAVLGAVALPFERAVWAFTPDRLDPAARPVPVSVEAEGVFMVRGAWPDLGQPYGVSPLWEH